VSQTSLLIDAVRALESAGVGYMLTGSLASSLQGEPRSTHDVDLVIEVDVRVVEALAAAFGTDAYHFDGIAAIDALGIDFWALTDEPFDQSRFSRRVMCPVFGFEVAVSAPEDTILQKLRWSSSLGGSERQLRDAVGVYQVQRGALDEGYLETWSKALEIVEALADVRRLAAE
jgi:hypothetical protein